jgi:hypothetical protein
MKDSEDEDDGMNSAIDASTIELISCLIPKIKDQLVSITPTAINCVYDTNTQIPLGSERLRSVELL